MTSGERAGLLARSPRDELIDLADRLLEEIEVEVALPVRMGTIQLQVREPVEEIRFQLADVLVTETLVRSSGREGWGIRLGRDPQAAMAAAICDVVVEIGHPRAPDVDRLCEATGIRLATERSREWAEVAPTVVHFEELDG